MNFHVGKASFLEELPCHQGTTELSSDCRRLREALARYDQVV